MSLKNDLLKVFEDMESDEDFANGIAKAVKDYAESLQINTVDAGTVPTGVFAGTGNGSITCNDELCSDIILIACNSMIDMAEGGDILLSTQLALAINTMMSAAIVDCDVSGTVTLPNGATSSLAGTSKGTFAGVPSSMQIAFGYCFNMMTNMTEGGDDYMATQMAVAIEMYLKSGIITTAGQGTLTGSVGNGGMQ